MRTIRKYIGLYVAFFRASLTADLEFRANFVIRIVTDIFWYVSQVLSFELLYRYTDHIGDWRLPEMRIFLGVLFVVDALTMLTFQTNLGELSEKSRKGALDLLLTKPVNSQFMVSFQRAGTAHLGNLLISVAWLAWACAAHPGFSAARLPWLLVLIPCGFTVFYVSYFLFSTASVVFSRADNLQYLWYHIYRLGLRPDNIYPPWLKYLVLTLLPMGFVASVPARLLLGHANPWLAPWAVLVSAASLWFSSWIWNLALRQYSSASS